MNLVNTHERRISRPLSEIFDELVALGTAADRIWPESAMPFRRTAGPMQVGVTSEQHGPIRAILDAYEVNKRIVWRANLRLLQGTHSFEVQEARDGSTLVRHVIQGRLAWWFGPIWRLYVSGVHDRIIEGLFDRLAAGATR